MPADLSVIENRAPHVAALLNACVSRAPEGEAYRFPVGEQWQSVTWSEVGTRVNRLAAGLISLGIGHEDRVGIAAGTRYEWILADLAIMACGGATTTVYPSTMADDVAYILSDSGCTVVFAEDATQLAKLQEKRADIPQVAKVVLIDGEGDGDWVISLDDLAQLGDAQLAKDPDSVTRAQEAITPKSLATLIYTSGTTGRPKGVRLLQEAWTYEGAAIQAQHLLTLDDLQFLWLPMAHSFGKVLLSTQLAIGFPTAVDGRVDKIVENLGIVKPTFMGAAPRIFEKAHARIVMMQAAEGGPKEKIFKRAFEIGTKARDAKAEGKSVGLLDNIQLGLFDKLVFSKVRERFGGRVRFFISGAAPLNADIAKWFDAAGIQILEGYGLTETSAGTFVNQPTLNKIGTVGPVFPGTEVKISDAGEILIKGPGVMDGYHNRDEDTAAALVDGWLHTGDKGELDSDGYLKITGRIKDLFKTSGGKYIAPSAIEAKFKAICPYASQFQVFGHAQKYCVALVTLDPDAMAEWAKEHGMEGKSYAQIVDSPEAKAMVGEYIEQLNSELNRWETIKKWSVLDHDLTVESGELTPSLKVKRNVLETNYADTLSDLFGG